MEECAICSDPYTRIHRRPMVGKCGHTLCFQCVAHLLSDPCPTCRKTGAFVNAPTNFTLLQLLEKYGELGIEPRTPVAPHLPQRVENSIEEHLREPCPRRKTISPQRSAARYRLEDQERLDHLPQRTTNINWDSAEDSEQDISPRRRSPSHGISLSRLRHSMEARAVLDQERREERQRMEDLHQVRMAAYNALLDPTERMEMIEKELIAYELERKELLNAQKEEMVRESLQRFGNSPRRRLTRIFDNV